MPLYKLARVTIEENLTAIRSGGRPKVVPVDDMCRQIESVMLSTSVIFANHRMTSMQTSVERADGYGNNVKDVAIFECSQRKPRAELFSVVPKGDANKPNAKRPT